MKKIAIFQSELGVGGIQKSIVNLLKSIDYDKFQVDLYLSRKDRFWDITFPEKLNIFYLRPTPKLYSFLPFELAMRLLKYDFEGRGEYDLAVDFNSYQVSCAVGALTIPAKRRVMWIHNNVQIKLENEWKYRVLWNFFKGKFKYYDGFVPVSRALEAPFGKMSGVQDKPFTVIENLIDVKEIREKMADEPEALELDETCLNFVALGRLCHQKGYDIMLDEFAKACEKRDDIRLYIIGGGPDREALEQQCVSLNIADKVCFLGHRENPYAIMARMDAFISTSRYEGQPLNIMEAMAVGLPLYCAKNLEKYTDGLEGREDIAKAIVEAKKVEKKPDDLMEYNKRILDNIAKLAESAE